MIRLGLEDCGDDIPAEYFLVTNDVQNVRWLRGSSGGMMAEWAQGAELLDRAGKRRL